VPTARELIELSAVLDTIGDGFPAATQALADRVAAQMGTT
jgi:hypothetical protein